MIQAVAGLPAALVGESATVLRARLLQLGGDRAMIPADLHAEYDAACDASAVALSAQIAEAEKRESDAAELARLRAEAEARAREERDEQLRREGEEHARKQAEQAIAEQAARAEREKAAAIEAERRKAADERQRQEAEAKRLADEQAARAQVDARRKADAAHRHRIEAGAVGALCAHAGLSSDQAQQVVQAVRGNLVPGLRIEY
jgi:hypothetical protein